MLGGLVNSGHGLMSEQISLLAVVNVPCTTELVVSPSSREIGREFMRKDLATFFERRAMESSLEVAGEDGGTLDDECAANDLA